MDSGVQVQEPVLVQVLLVELLVLVQVQVLLVPVQVLAVLDD
jgi:hypothetical protein